MAILKIFELDKEGIFHVCGNDRVSRYDFARETALVFDFDPQLIRPVTLSELGQTARRPPVTGFITLKAETVLGIKPMGIHQGLTLFKREFYGGRF